MTEIAVTGSTGYVGRRVAENLSAAGVATRLVVRDASRAPSLPHSTVHVAPYEQIDAVREALTGVDVVFMVSLVDDNRRLALQSDFVAAASQAGVRHVVYLSFAGADATSPHLWERDHGLTEQLLRDLGFDLTVLRSHHYHATVVDFAIWGDILGPGGDGRLASVAREDVAAVAAAILADPRPHVGRTYRLTGPESVDFHRIADVVTRYRGSPCAYRPQSEEQFAARCRELDIPADLASAWLGHYRAISRGAYDVVTDDVETITGRPARGLEETILDGHT